MFLLDSNKALLALIYKSTISPGEIIPPFNASAKRSAAKMEVLGITV